uniref:Uncharacterized protein n=1 Tax=Romanomermis culicivorax TaxID=13658 RepID=A0A915HVH5_ROMCU
MVCTGVPKTSTPYFSKIPFLYNSTPQFKAVWPPKVNKIPSALKSLTALTKTSNKSSRSAGPAIVQVIIICDNNLKNGHNIWDKEIRKSTRQWSLQTLPFIVPFSRMIFVSFLVSILYKIGTLCFLKKFDKLSTLFQWLGCSQILSTTKADAQTLSDSKNFRIPFSSTACESLGGTP